MKRRNDVGGLAGQRAKVRFLAVPAILLLAACSPAESGILAGTTIISLLETDKTVSDHIMSQMMNKDCSSKRLLEGADRMCIDENESATKTVAQSTPTYCYRTLGNISCYTKPNPYDPNVSEVAWPRPTQPEPAPSLALRDGENKGN
jgi:hypothetical protein